MEEKNDWLHNLGALVVAIVFTLSPFISALSWKLFYISSNDAEYFGYGLMATVFSFITGLLSRIIYNHFKER